MAVTKIQVFGLVCSSLIILTCVKLYFNSQQYDNKNIVSERLDYLSDKKEDTFFTLAKLLQQRNNFSRELNLKQQRIGKMECESKKDGNKVSSTGGWCAQTSVEDSGEHKTDTKLVPVLAEFFKGKSVASFGDGPGRYKQMLSDTGLLKVYDAYDGAPFSEETSEGRVQFLDLTLAQYGLPLYDWVMSLEVAEHIPQDYEAVYVDNIVRHAKEGVVLSWATPGQVGYSHINNRPFSYVKELFEKLGFVHDQETSDKLKKAASLDWLQRNTNVYRRKDLSKTEHLKTFWT